MGRSKFVHWRAEDYVRHISVRKPDLVLAIMPCDLYYVPVLNKVASEGNPDGAVLIYTDASSDEEVALRAYGYHTYANPERTIVVGYKPQTEKVGVPRIHSFKAKNILGL